MLKGRRVGTLTAGIVLVISGIMFLLRSVINNIDISLIVSFWPMVLVLLGIEILTAYIINKEEKMKYDFGAVVLVMLLLFFAMGMGVTEFITTHWAVFKGTI
ncbi:DUF5668 domain-containing protein [Clostridium sp. Marseille-Q2269]|uniref:LiaF transmembrane domain-containing protein n=1 Tax=Clostridium sp. Marseille-Q2269 TaxID=2942205 RepID=UPI0020736E40|nr:DUF5668 domain-containing protein [Clostridium sp. Marseille-Q2269]